VKHVTEEKLAKLRAEVDREYGKLVQKLLAAAFLETGVEKLVERSTQGIDLEMDIAGVRCVFEVKTSKGDTIRLGPKDLEGLDRLVDDGAVVYVAVLTSAPLEDWVFARYAKGEFPAGKDLSSFPFRASRDRELEARVRGAFDQVVDAHLHTAITKQQRGLDEMLRTYPEWGRA